MAAASCPPRIRWNRWAKSQGGAMTRLPSRVTHLEDAHREHGDLIDRLAPWFWRTDPLGDAAVDALESTPGGWSLVDRALTRGIDAVPEAPDALKQLFASL